jgi:ketosteroid isomerase-like protein
MLSNKDVVKLAWRSFSTRDPKEIEPFFTEDAVWIAPPRNATAIAAGKPEVTRMSRSEIASFIAKDFGRVFVADVAIDFTGLFGEDDIVVLQNRTRATLANGRKYDLDYCFVFKLREGRICEMREYMDTLGGFRQIYGEEAIKPVTALV